MELAHPPTLRRVNGKNGQTDRCGAFAPLVRDDNVTERSEAESARDLMERNNLAPLPAQ